MKNKKLVIALVVLVVVVAALACVYFMAGPKATAGEKTFTLTVVHSDGTSKEVTIASSEEFLAPALREEGILTDDGTETGMYLIVDGETASWEENQAYWGFFVNGDFATAGINDTPIEDGATYKLEYTIGGW